MLLLRVHQRFTYESTGNADVIKLAALNYCSKANLSCFFDGNRSHSDTLASFDWLAAIGSDSGRADPFLIRDQWAFGYFSYDLKNRIEGLSSENHDGLGFAEELFFIPSLLLEAVGKTISVRYDPAVYSELQLRKLLDEMQEAGSAKAEHTGDPVVPAARISRDEYLRKVSALQRHILRGDIYEVNFCMEFFSENAVIEPLAVYLKLNSISRAPFSAFCKFGDKYLLSSSPERFLKKTGDVLISQPIKGTARRGRTSEEDDHIVKQLKNDKKEQSENVMIVDLVRNDLSRIALPGTVRVDELFGIHTFDQVHQMISTVSCKLPPSAGLKEIIYATFPMGSMTGAPKVSAMKLIEKYESTRRGLYSGAVGYITPGGWFDLSVVIRSILYNSTRKYLSFMVGSAITAASDPEKEYEECLLKAKALFEALR